MKKKSKRRIFACAVAVSIVFVAVTLTNDIVASLKETDISDFVPGVEEVKQSAKVLTEFKELGKSDNEPISDPEPIESGSNVSGDEWDLPDYSAVGYIVRVVDGDTYILDIEGEEKRVRLIGVDTPESVAPDDYRTDNTAEGREVSDIVKEKLTEGEMLYIEYDVETTDKYDRTLAYLYFSDGEMVQDWLLSNGLANTATYPPNVKYEDHFAELAHKAMQDKVGLWSGFFEESESK